MIDMRSYILSKFPDASLNASGKIHACCPFHDDRRPSFSIDVNKGVFICGSSSCGVRGTFPLFYKLMENITTWKEVYSDLKDTSTDYDLDDLFKGSVVTQKGQQVNEFPSSDCVEPIGHLDYLVKRGIGQEVIDTFGLLYGKIGEFSGIKIAQSIVCPVWDIDGSYKTFQLRYIGFQSKKRWFNPLNSPIQHLLYGGWYISKQSPYLWIVEGASDTWNVASYGDQAVGLNTKEASASQMNKILTLCRLYQLQPVVCLDGDAHEASKKLYSELSAMGLSGSLLLLDKTKDPGSLTYEEFKQLRESLNG